MGYVLGPKAAEACQEELTKNKIQVPSPATLSENKAESRRASDAPQTPIVL